MDLLHNKNQKGIKISLVFPAHNEEANIAKSIEQALQILPQVAEEYEVVVTDDGSTDRTGEIIDSIASQNPHVRAIHHPKNLGYGGSVKSGIYAAQYDLIFLCDADLQFDLAEMPKLLKWINDYDLVIGYRLKRQDSLHRRINARCWHILIRILFGLKIKDIDCAFKLFRSSIFQRIKLSSNGAMISTELLTQAKEFGFKIKELPVSHYPRLEGKQSGANIKVVLRAFRDLFKFYREMRQKKYATRISKN